MVVAIELSQVGKRRRVAGTEGGEGGAREAVVRHAEHRASDSGTLLSKALTAKPQRFLSIWPGPDHPGHIPTCPPNQSRPLRSEEPGDSLEMQIRQEGEPRKGGEQRHGSGFANLVSAAGGGGDEEAIGVSALAPSGRTEAGFCQLGSSREGFSDCRDRQHPHKREGEGGRQNGLLRMCAVRRRQRTEMKGARGPEGTRAQ